ncbi:MAG: hypothetical protein P4K86_09705 [Terracidiphilus sp.]|nr:hypothetical protein [Terracidiphilus sp.]
MAETSDGQLYVVKFVNNPQGANLAFNECMGSELYSAFGLSGPAWTPLLVTDSFLDKNPASWMQTPDGPLRPASGLCFGSRFLGGNDTRLLEILPGTSFKRVINHKTFWLAWLIDICARHADNRQAVFLQQGSGELQAFFIDHGHLFGGPKGGKQPHFIASRYIDPRVYQNVSSPYLVNLKEGTRGLDVDRLWKRIQELPCEWATVSAAENFAQCLDRLSNRNLVQNIVDTMVDAQQRTDELECSKSRYGLPLADEVLRPRVLATKLGDCYVHSRARHPACA